MPPRQTNAAVLDTIDRQILRLLQRDGRLSIRDLESATGLSRSAVWERRRRLEQLGIIAGYQAIVTPMAIAGGMDAVIRCQFAANIGDFARFRAALRESDLIYSAHKLDGLGGVQIRAASPKAIAWLQAEITACRLEMRAQETHFVVEDIAPHRAPMIDVMVPASPD